MTLALFDDVPEPSPKKKAPASSVLPAQVSEDIQSLAKQLPPALRLGTSSWHFPGWADLVWDQPYAEAKLSKEGLRAYGQHPLLRTVSLDRAFYRPMTVEQYAQLAAQVSDDFRFVVKVPSVISDALIRSSGGEDAGRGLQANTHFLDVTLFQDICLKPLLEGLGNKLGALVLQMSPLPAHMLSHNEISKLFGPLAGILSAQSAMKNVVPDAVMAIELRNPEFITTLLRDELIALLKDTGATYCLGLHAKLPPIEDQLPILRKLWPGPLVCRWNLHSKHGRYGYEAAKASYEPFDKLIDEDPATREQLARVIAGTVKGGQTAFVTINNKAEGSAPLSVAKLAQAVLEKI
ncbi:MAG: DUF72 domain-containing protein [Burkholderiales bacterium]|nr:MAG: DUF72 domain-containing protein [Burkholderiales bacterium]